MTDLIEREAAIAAITLGNTVTRLQNNIRALPAAQVSVKPLVWEDRGYDWSWWSDCGEYRIRLDGAFHVDRDGETISSHTSLTSAKAAAQADYDARIRAALDVAPVSLAEAARVPEIAALIEAAKRVWNEACANHDKEPPTKYMAPYGGLVAVHNALRAIAGGTE